MIGRLGSFFLDVLEVVVFAIAIFLFIYLLILRPHKIKGASMEPNYPDGEYLLTEKVSYYLHEPQRGDVIVFKPPASVTVDDEYIKRIIGIPGDKVSIQNGKVSVNGKILPEKYLNSTLFTSGNAFLEEGATVTVPPGELFVLGDNRPHSSDSRVWGFVEKTKISGKAWLVYWPIPRSGLVPKVTYEGF